jgi:cobalt/nickel transport system permease protein
MHMPDALVSAPVGIAFGAAAAGLVIHSARAAAKKPAAQTAATRTVATMGVLGAFVFGAQMLNCAIPGVEASGHLAGGFLLAVLLGAHRAFLVMASVLLVQAGLGDGGLLAYGANLFNLGFVPCLVVYPLLRKFIDAAPGVGRVAMLAFAGGFLSLMAGAVGMAAQTALSGTLPFTAFAPILLAIHIPIGVFDGLATALIVILARHASPEWLRPTAAVPSAPRRLALSAFLVAAVAMIGLFAAGVASEKPDGLEWSVERVAAVDAPEQSDAGAKVG